MVRVCKTCEHPDVVEINDLLLKGVPIRVVAQKFNLPYHSVQRHKKNHLAAEIRQLKKMKKIGTDKKILSTLEYYDQFLKYFSENPDKFFEQMTLKEFLKILEDRSKLLGEEVSPPRIEIVWGAGLNEELKEEAFRITIPIKKEKKEDD